MTGAQRSEAAILRLQEINPDICGWLRIEHTDIDCPVLMQSFEDDAYDPAYYLQLDYRGEKSSFGSVFVGGYTSPNGTPLLYGRNRRYGNLFWELPDYTDVKP